MIKSTTRVGHLARVFRYSDDDEKRMQVQFARLCVLYDDLMLEYAGADEESIPVLDASRLNARRFQSPSSVPLTFGQPSGRRFFEPTARTSGHKGRNAKILPNESIS
jgi:hypothetical protein